MAGTSKTERPRQDARRRSTPVPFAGRRHRSSNRHYIGSAYENVDAALEVVGGIAGMRVHPGNERPRRTREAKVQSRWDHPLFIVDHLQKRPLRKLLQ